MQRLFVALLAMAVVAAPSAQAFACVCDQPAERSCCAPAAASCCCCPEPCDEEQSGVHDCGCTKVPPRIQVESAPDLDQDAPASLPLLDSEVPAVPADARVSAARGEARPALNRPLLV